MSSGFNMRYYDPIVGQDPPSQSEPASAYMKDDPYGSKLVGNIDSPCLSGLGLRKLNGLQIDSSRVASGLGHQSIDGNLQMVDEAVSELSQIIESANRHQRKESQNSNQIND